MPFSFRKFIEGIRLVPKSSTTVANQGEMEVLSSNGKLNYHNGATASPMVTEAHTATLTNKTLTAPTITGATLSVDDTDSAFNLNIASTSTLTGDKTLTLDVNDASRTVALSGNISTGGNVTTSADLTTTGAGTLTIAAGASNRSVTLGGNITTAHDLITSGANSLTLTTTGTTDVTLPTTGTLATLAGSETLTNKTLTSPVINTANIDTGTATNTQRIVVGKETLSNLTALTRKEAAVVYATDTQSLYIDNGSSLLPIGGNWTTYSNQNISASGTVTLSTTIGLQYRRVTGNGAAVTASTTPFGSTPPSDGTVIRLVGQSNTNTVTFVNNDAAKGFILNGDATLAQYHILEVQYDSTADRYIEISRNF